MKTTIISKNTKETGFYITFLVAVMAFCVFFGARFGYATSFDKPAVLTYDIYTGGLHVLDADLSLKITKKGYFVMLSSATKGFLGRLVPWSGSFETVGMMRGEQLQVREHKSISTWKGSSDIAVYRYDAGGKFQTLSLQDDGQDKTPQNIDKQLTDKTTDVLTATLGMMMSAKKTQECKGESAIFDSRRRFNLVYKDKGKANLLKSRYGFYTGPAMMCTAEVIPDGGAWHKKPRGWLSIQEQGRKKGTLPTLWLAKIDPSLPPIPVKIQIKTDYGTLLMHLSRAKIADKVYEIKK